MEVFYCDISKVNISDINLSLISKERLVKANDYNTHIKKIQSLVSYLLLRYVFLKRSIDILNYEFSYNLYGKPSLSGVNYDFSISHSNNIVAVIVDDDFLGLDIEMIDYKKDLTKLQRVLTKEELEEYSGLSTTKQKEYFYGKWVMKEAHFKMLGIGYKKEFNSLNLSYKLKYINDTFNNQYIISSTVNDFTVIEVEFNDINR